MRFRPKGSQKAFADESNPLGFDVEPCLDGLPASTAFVA